MRGVIDALAVKAAELVGMRDGFGFSLGHTDANRLPECNGTRPNEERSIRGASGVADRTVVCEKDATNAYAWRDKGHDYLVATFGGGGGGPTAILVQEGDASVVLTADTIDFDATDFNVSAAGSEANISLAYGTAPGTPAEGNHTHTPDHAAVTVLDSASIDLTLAGQQITAAAVFGTAAGTVAQGDHTHASSLTPPGGATTQVQFNDAGVFGGDSGLTFNKAGDALSIGTTPALGGKLNLVNNAEIRARNASNTGDVFIAGASGDDKVYLGPGSNLQLGTDTVINPQSANSDTIVRGDLDSNLLFADASADRVGIGTATPATKLDVVGTAQVSGATTLAALAGTGTRVVTAQSAGQLGATPIGVGAGQVAAGDHTHAGVAHDPVTVLDSSSINFTLVGQEITAVATYGITSTTVARGDHTHGTPGGTTQVIFNDAGTLSGDAGLTYNKTTDTLAVAGGVTVPTEVYGAPWNGSNQVPTKDAVYDKIEAMTAASGISQAAADLRYLKLAADNDPLTGALSLNLGAVNAGLQVIGTAAPGLEMQNTAPAAAGDRLWRVVVGNDGAFYVQATDAALTYGTKMFMARTGGPSFAGLGGTGYRNVVADGTGALSAVHRMPAWDVVAIANPWGVTEAIFDSVLNNGNYLHYKIEVFCQLGMSELYLQLRAGGVNKASNYSYQGPVTYNNGTAMATGYSASNTIFPLVTGGQENWNYPSSASIEIFYPQLTTYTPIHVKSQFIHVSGGAIVHQDYYGERQVAEVIDGFRIYSAGANPMYAWVQVYGMRAVA